MATKSLPKTFGQFLENRHLTKEIAEQFQLGFAPHNSIVYNYLSSLPDEKLRKEVILLASEIGLIRKDKRGGEHYYDTFRDRIIFPIWDHSGHVNGFTSRCTSDEQKPKYLNSPASFIFDKKNLLYGLHFAKSYIRSRDRVILVEGNMDVVALVKSGFEETVAIMGTALGEQSLKTLKGFSQNIYLCLDQDDAGKAAAKRSAKMFLEEGILVKTINLAPFKDPDDFLVQKGPVAFKERLDEAKLHLDMEIEDLIPDVIPELSDRKLEILELVFELVSPLEEGLFASEKIIQVSKRLMLQSSAEQINKAYSDYLKSKVKPFPKKSNEQRDPTVAEMPYNASLIETAKALDELDAPIEKTAPLKLTKGEKILLNEIVQHPELLMRGNITELLDLVVHNEVKNYLLRLKNLIFEIEESEFPQLLKNLLAQEDLPLAIKEVVSSGLFGYRAHDPANKVAKIMEKLLADIKRELEKDRLMIQKKELKGLLKTCQTQEEANTLMKKLSELDRELTMMKTQRIHQLNQ